MKRKNLWKIRKIITIITENNNKYLVISEDSCDKNKVSLSDESKKSVNDDVNNLINIIGDDIIEYM